MNTMRKKISQHQKIGKILLVLFVSILVACHKAPQETTEKPSFDSLVTPEIRSENVLLLDVENQSVLWDKKADEKVYPASLTKLMTAILAIEHLPNLEETIEITSTMLEGLKAADANMAGFQVGDEPTARDLIYGDLLPSGADCSRALAYHIAGSEAAFVEMMNAKAKELNMDRTHFANTSGLFDTTHYSTCEDLAKLFSYCIKNDTFMEVLQTLQYRSSPVASYKNGLLMDNYVLVYVNQPRPGKFTYTFDIPGFIGGKGGYTIESRYNLASIAEVNGRLLMLITIHAYIGETYPAAIKDAQTIYAWARDTFTYQTIVDGSEAYEVPSIRFSNEKDLLLVPEAPYAALASQANIVVEAPAIVNAPIEKGQVLGALEIYEHDVLVKSVPLVANKQVPLQITGILRTLVYELTHAYWWVGFSIVLILLILVCIWLLLPKRRKKRKRKRL